MENKLLALLQVISDNKNKQIIELLNVSNYVTEYKVEGKKFVHTGVKFNIQTNQTLEIYYDYEMDNLIVQPPTNKIIAEPKLGDIFIGGTDFINFPTNLVVDILGINQFYLKLLELEDLEEKLNSDDNILTIRVFQNSEYTDIKFDKASNHLAYKIYLGNGSYDIYNPNIATVMDDFNNNFESEIYFDEEEEEEEDNSSWGNRSSFYDATDGQLGELGDDGWTYLGRD